MKQLVLDPASAIMHAKKEKNATRTVEILIIEWILAGIATFVFTKSLGATISVIASLSIVLFGVVGNLFGGFLVQLVFNVLGGRGNYLRGLMSIVYAEFPVLFGLFLISILSQLSFLLFPMSLIVSAIFSIIGLATLYRSVREFFSVDMITAWIGISILIGGLVLAVYLSSFSFLATHQNLLSILMMKRGA